MSKTGEVDKDRNIGIAIAYSGDKFLSPNLTRRKNWVWKDEEPESDPNQGWAP